MQIICMANYRDTWRGLLMFIFFFFSVWKDCYGTNYGEAIETVTKLANCNITNEICIT